MADIDVTFISPTDSRAIKVTLDDSLTTKDIVDKLIENQFIPSHEGGYGLAVKGGAEIPANSTLARANVKNGTTLRVLTNTDAG
ncbi:MAG: hypothetical protein HQL06_11045 [Nitrospirae bacterium]|nr:hypothetical protein [Nitrospirota bacterium]